MPGTTREFTFASGGQRLAGRLHQPAGTPKAAAVVAHGLASSMASRKLTNLSAALAQAGCLPMQFDHSGCGLSPGDQFDTSLTIRRDELLAAAEHLHHLDPDLPMAYLGSSMGGLAAMAASDLRPPACLCVWSAPSDLEELFRGLAGDPEAEAYREFRRDAFRHDLDAVIARLSRILVVHGENDQVVPVAQARRTHDLAREPKELFLLPGADHQLTDLDDQKRAMEASLAWVERFTAGGEA